MNRKFLCTLTVYKSKQSWKLANAIHQQYIRFPIKNTKAEVICTWLGLWKCHSSCKWLHVCCGRSPLLTIAYALFQVSIALMVMCALYRARILRREGWKCARTTHGGQYVKVVSTVKLLRSFVGSWDCQSHVSTILRTMVHSICCTDVY